MIEQKVIIHLKDEFSNDIGTLTVSSIDYRNDYGSFYQISDSMVLENIDLVDEADNLTPIQYYNKESSQFAHLMLLEETEYQVLFESDDINATYDVLYSLNKINKSHFKKFRFDLGNDNKFKLAGTLNFRSYVGKSFLDVKKGILKSIPIPIEVRSKKIDYFNQYSAMIADLSQHALSLIFEVNSPLYQEFILDDEKNYPNTINRETFDTSFPMLERTFETESIAKSEDDKFPLIYVITALYTTFILEEPIHPVGSEFPGSLKVENKNGKFLCPVKDNQKDNPNAICHLCLAEQTPDI